MSHLHPIQPNLSQDYTLISSTGCTCFLFDGWVEGQYFTHLLFCCVLSIFALTSSSSSHRAISTDMPDPLYLPSESSIVSGRSSEFLPLSAQSCCMQVLAGHPAFTRSCEGVHKRTSLMSSSLLLQLRPACLVRLTLIVFLVGDRWPYSCCFVGRYFMGCYFVGCCLHDLFNIARSILVKLPSSFFSILLVNVLVAHPYSQIN